MNDLKNLINLLKKFDGKPETLANYLILWDALKSDFKKRVINSEVLENLDKVKKPRTINDIINNNQKLLDPKVEVKKIKNKKINVNEEYNKKLQEYLNLEDYESAALLRDLMLKHNIKKNI